MLFLSVYFKMIDVSSYLCTCVIKIYMLLLVNLLLALIVSGLC
jgi:hypothetical protein